MYAGTKFYMILGSLQKSSMDETVLGYPPQYVSLIMYFP